MSSSRLSTNRSEDANRAPNATDTAPNLSISSTQNQSATSSASPAPPSWSSPSPALQNRMSPSVPQYSATTAEILNRIRAGATGHAAGTPAFEAKKAEIMKDYLTSDTLPTPQISGTGRRGRGGRVGTPSQLKTEVGTSPATGATPTSARGSGRGRGRGRGRGGGRGGKRKRSESFDSDNDSDISSSYTPLQTRTKSGRSVNKPVSFVPTIPEPTAGVKRRRSNKTILAAQCNVCHRGTDPANNRIVFCDMCNTAYHQYCHDPPIDNDVVTVLEKEWLCGPCERSKQNVVQGTEDLIAGTGLSIDEKRTYLSTLPQSRLVSLLLHSTIRHPELPLFPSNIQDLLPDRSSTSHPPAPTTDSKPTQNTKPSANPTPPTFASMTSPPTTNGRAPSSTANTPRSQHPGTDTSEIDPAEAQLLGEISRSHNSHHINNGAKSKPSATSAAEDRNGDNADGNEDDGYDTDPPAHYPKAGNGLARTLGPEAEDLEWLVDDGYEVFSHS